MNFIRTAIVVVIATIRYYWILFLNRKLIRELKRLSRQDPKLLITLKTSTTDPRKIDYDMKYLD